MSSEGIITNKQIIQTKQNNINIITSLFVAFTFGIFAPIEMYFVNINNLWFDLYDILPGLLLISAVLFAICYALTWGLNILLGKPENRIYSRIWEVTVVLISILGISIYMQGNFLQAEYDKIGTEKIDWSRYNAEGISNVIGWLGMFIIFFALLYKLRIDRFLKFLKHVMVIILLVQITTLIIVAFVQHGFIRKNDYVATTEDEWILSKNKNYITLVLDTYDARIFDDLLNSDGGEEYMDMLEDFTFYRNTLTVFTLTDFSIPQILTGQKYLNQEDYGPFIEKAYNNSPFLNLLKEDGYDINVYTTVTLPQTGIVEDIKNWHRVDKKSSNYPKLYGLYYKMILFRYMPHYLKKPFEINIEEFDDLDEVASIDGHKPVAGSDPEIFSYGNIEFIEGISLITAPVEKKHYKFYHIKGIHHTRDLDRNLNEVTYLGEDGEGVSLEESAMACMKIIDLFLEKLKTEGVYDDSVIVIMADHGAADYIGGGHVQSPVLCIKGINEKHKFRTDESPISYEDLQEGFINLLNGKTGDEVFSVKEGEERTRTMYYTGFIGQRRRFTRNEPFIEIQTTGHAFDLKFFKKTGVEY